MDMLIEEVWWWYLSAAVNYLPVCAASMRNCLCPGQSWGPGACGIVLPARVEFRLRHVWGFDRRKQRVENKENALAEATVGAFFAYGRTVGLH